VAIAPTISAAKLMMVTVLKSISRRRMASGTVEIAAIGKTRAKARRISVSRGSSMNTANQGAAM